MLYIGPEQPAVFARNRIVATPLQGPRQPNSRQ
jgi:hypothetical protein